MRIRTMSSRPWKHTLALVLIFALLAPAALLLGARSAGAQGRQDIGRQMEQEYGVLGRDTPEGRRYNDLLDRSVERILKGVNAQRSSSERFNLRSARILGGRTKKNDEIVNAFALPDGRIYVTLGLLRAIEGSPKMEDELAFVVGHEVTHVSEKHSKHQQKKALEAGIVALIIGAVTRDQTAGTIANAGAAAYVSKFSRKDEYRADRGGLIAMHYAGYDLDAAATMLGRLRQKGESQNKTLIGWFGSHPLTENRVKRVQEMARDLRAGREIGDRSEKELERDDRKRR